MTDGSSEAGFRVDDAGVHLPAGHEGSVDVHFDDHHAWSFSAHRGEDRGDELLVAWPKRMRGWLDGTSRVRLVEGDDELWSGDVVLGSGEGRITFLDKQGLPVMIDKWGLLQRPFSGRGREAVEQMVDVTERILEVMRDECGVEAWIAFGTLLGAAREGGVIGHDSDIDLAYLSHRATPAEMVQELHGVARALRRDGLDVMDKSGSFITVVFRAPDGAQGSIDVYTCFHVGDLLYETATVRAPVPASAIEPLTTLEFEGRRLPAPADPDRMLAESYGPSWRVPDPSFKHTPGPEITGRFADWFGSLMRNRRDWEAWANAQVAESPHAPRSDFVDWVLAGSAESDRVVEVGCGPARDALALARAGREVLALDYGRGRRQPVRRAARREGLQLTFKALNLYDLRDTLTRAALVARDGNLGDRVVVARELVEALDPDGVEAFWRFCSLVLRRGGRALVEGVAATRAELAEQQAEEGGGRRRPVDPRNLEARAVRLGGRVTGREGFADAARAVHGNAGGPVRWRMTVEWPGPDPVDRPHRADREG